VYWLMVTVVALIVFGVAAVASGQGGALAPARPDRPELDLPPGPLGPDALAGLRFTLGFRGYRMDEVDRVLDRLLAELAWRDERIAELERGVTGGELASRADTGGERASRADTGGEFAWRPDTGARTEHGEG
jgi:DivIVA domain-containing protein